MQHLLRIKGWSQKIDSIRIKTHVLHVASPIWFLSLHKILCAPIEWHLRTRSKSRTKWNMTQTPSHKHPLPPPTHTKLRNNGFMNDCYFLSKDGWSSLYSDLNVSFEIFPKSEHSLQLMLDQLNHAVSRSDLDGLEQ